MKCHIVFESKAQVDLNDDDDEDNNDKDDENVKDDSNDYKRFF